MCNCRNTYPLSVQLRMAAVEMAIRAGELRDDDAEFPPKEDGNGYTKPEKVTVELLDRAAEIEEFLAGDYTDEQLDAPQKPQKTDAEFRATMVIQLKNNGLIKADKPYEQERLATWIEHGR